MRAFLLGALLMLMIMLFGRGMVHAFWPHTVATPFSDGQIIKVDEFNRLFGTHFVEAEWADRKFFNSVQMWNQMYWAFDDKCR